jgi:hypothetical protein
MTGNARPKIGTSAKVRAIREHFQRQQAQMTDAEREQAQDETDKEIEANLRRSADKVREDRLRRMAKRQGLELVKSRRRDPRALGFGRYMIVDAASNAVVAGEIDSPRALDLDAVEAYLNRNVPTTGDGR